MSALSIPLIKLLVAPAMLLMLLQGVTTFVRTDGAPPAGGPTCSGNLASESFDPVGYDVVTSEFGGCNAIDEDDTTRTETYFDGRDLLQDLNGGCSYCGCVARYEGVGDTARFVSAAIYVATEDIAGTEWYGLMALANEGIGHTMVCVGLLGDGAAGVDLAVTVATDGGDTTCMNGGGVTKDLSSFSTGTVYIVELEWGQNGATDTWGWKVWDCGSDGETGCTSTPDTSDTGTANISASNPDGFDAGMSAPESTPVSAVYYGFVEYGSAATCS